jgi:hypothetical protein
VSVDDAVGQPTEARPGAQRLAAWLAAASAVVALGALLFGALPVGRATTAPLGTPVWEIVAIWLREWAVGLGDGALGLVTGVAVPAVGAWLAARREPLRGTLGLAAVATWGVLTLPGVVVGVPRIVAAPSATSVMHAHELADVLALLALVAAVVALRGRAAPGWLNGTGARRLAAAGLVAWALGATGADLAIRVSAATQLPLHNPFDGAVQVLTSLTHPALALLILLGIAVVVWRRDSLLVVPAFVVIGVHEVVPALIDAVRTVRFGEELLFGTPLPEPVTVAGVDVTILGPVITVLAAVVFVAATGPLVAATRRAWRSR